MLKIIPGFLKFLVYPRPSYHKISNISRYASLYSHMHRDRQTTMAQDIEADRLKNEAQLKDTNLLKQLASLKERALDKIQDMRGKKQSKEINLKEILKIYTNRGFEYLALYYESLQSLVEGRREVLHNENYKFDDGQTVKQKQMQMQRKLRKFMGQKPPPNNQN